MSKYPDEIRNKLNTSELSCFFKSVILDDNKTQDLFFYNPVDILAAYSHKEINSLLSIVDEKLKLGLYVAGYFAYEAGYGFEEKFHDDQYYDKPLVVFGVYEKPQIIPSNIHETKEMDICITNSLRNINKYINLLDYDNKISKIKEYISSGDVYQINYTYKYKFKYSCDTLLMYYSLLEKQNVEYSAYIEDKSRCIISLSPELFFKIKNGEIIVKPMKGTSERGRYIEEDIKLESLLSKCIKNKAENTMIVDLMRNDLGKICVAGSICTQDLFKIEKYSTLFQMTSIVKGKLKNNIQIKDIFKALFPSGSVTGAPKIRAMEIIKELENEQRGIYTGSVGYIFPNGDARFNVAIRTIDLDKINLTGELGIGSGIVWDSIVSKEFEECELKSNFLFKELDPEFNLIETLLWKNNCYFLLDYHIERLIKSALYFNYDFKVDQLHKKLKDISVKNDNAKIYKIRILLDRKGNISSEIEDINNISKEANLCITISDCQTASKNVFLYHKTTNRKLYDGELEKYRNLGFYEVVFTNEANQITEGAISNIFVKSGNCYYTPPVDCGVLPGVYRRYLMEKKGLKITEKILYKDDLQTADSIFMSNSVRGMVEVKLRNNPYIKE